MCLFIWSDVKFRFLFSVLESKVMENRSTLLWHLVMYAQLRDFRNYLEGLWAFWHPNWVGANCLSQPDVAGLPLVTSNPGEFLVRKGVPLFERTQTWISAGPHPTLSKEEEETVDPLEDSNYPNTLVSHRGRAVLTETDTSPVGFSWLLWGSGHSFHEVKN